jgi:hypothetical protein
MMVSTAVGTRSRCVRGILPCRIRVAVSVSRLCACCAVVRAMCTPSDVLHCNCSRDKRRGTGSTTGTFVDRFSLVNVLTSLSPYLMTSRVCWSCAGATHQHRVPALVRWLRSWTSSQSHCDSPPMSPPRRPSTSRSRRPCMWCHWTSTIHTLACSSLFVTMWGRGCVCGRCLTDGYRPIVTLYPLVEVSSSSARRCWRSFSAAVSRPGMPSVTALPLPLWRLFG